MNRCLNSIVIMRGYKEKIHICFQIKTQFFVTEIDSLLRKINILKMFFQNNFSTSCIQGMQSLEIRKEQNFCEKNYIKNDDRYLQIGVPNFFMINMDSNKSQTSFYNYFIIENHLKKLFWELVFLEFVLTYFVKDISLFICWTHFPIRILICWDRVSFFVISNSDSCVWTLSIRFLNSKW